MGRKGKVKKEKNKRNRGIMAEDISKQLETLNTKIDQLTNVIKEGMVSEKESTKEEEKILEEETKILDKISNIIEDLIKNIKGKTEVCEEKIKENPIPYVLGAFTGGVITGFLIFRAKEK